MDKSKLKDRSASNVVRDALSDLYLWTDSRMDKRVDEREKYLENAKKLAEAKRLKEAKELAEAEKLAKFLEAKKLAKMEHSLKPMTVATLKVVRESDFGVFLNAGTGNSNDDILLHKTQQTSEVKIGDSVEVFLYLDPKKRLTASMRVPKMKVGQIARLKVINVSKDGAFLDTGAERGIFMPYAEMTGKPQTGDIVWAKLYIDKSGRLATSMKVSDEIRRASKPAENIKRGDKIKGAIYNITEAGAFVFSETRNIVFIPQKDIPRKLKCGEIIEARVTFIREDGRLNASLREAKENAINDDAEKILKFIEENGGKINFTDKTEPEKIQAVFHISKASFKRAIGHLLKAQQIEKFDEGFKVRS